MKKSKIGDYVLGTEVKELNRLGFQHQVWKKDALKAWKNAGIKKGSKVIDIGSGPGFASYDLEKIVGKKGKVISIERSKNFVDFLNKKIKDENLNIETLNLDLDKDNFNLKNFDFVWDRWAISFLKNPERLIKRLRKSLKIGGKIIFHEYVEYKTFRLIPETKFINDFVSLVIKNWESGGGKPSIAGDLIKILTKNGFKIIHTEPKVYSAKPGTKYWNWPASFVRIYIEKLFELKQVDKVWMKKIKTVLNTAEKNQNSVFITPMVLEIIAERVK